MLHQARGLSRAPSTAAAAAAVPAFVGFSRRRGRGATASRSHQCPRRPRLIEHLRATGIAETAASSAGVRLAVGLGRWRGTLAQLGHQRQILVVHLCLGVLSARSEAGAGPPLLAVPGDVPRVSAGGADDAVGDVGLVLALPRLVVGGTAVGAPGPLALAQGAVEQRQLAQLGAPQVILPLGNVDAVADHLLDLLHGLFHRVEVVGGDVRVQRLVLAGQGLPVFPRDLSLLDGSFPSDDDLGAGVPLHRFQRVAPRTDEKSDKVDFWVFILWNHHFVVDLDHRRLVIWRRLVIRIEGHHFLDCFVASFLQLLALPILAGVQPLAIGRVYRLRRR